MTSDRAWIFIIVLIALIGIVMFFVGPKIAGG